MCIQSDLKLANAYGDLGSVIEYPFSFLVQAKFKKWNIIKYYLAKCLAKKGRNGTILRFIKTSKNVTICLN